MVAGIAHIAHGAFATPAVRTQARMAQASGRRPCPPPAPAGQPTSASSRLALSMPATSANVGVGTSLPLRLGLRFLP